MNTKENILAIPSKGSFKEESLRLLYYAGIEPEIRRRQLTTSTRVSGVGGLTVALMRPKDIVNQVALGRISLGIVGWDSVLEYQLKANNLPNPSRNSLLRAKLGIGYCRMVLAVPENQELPKVRDASGVIMPFRRRPYLEMLRGARIATSYPFIAKTMLDPNGEFQLTWEELGGSVEAAPKLGLGDAIVDLVEKGWSCKDNGLKEAFTLFRSRGFLIANRQLVTKRNEVALEIVDRIVKRSRPPRE